MLFTAPALDERELAVLAEIDELKSALKFQLAEPRRWTGSLRRLAFARNIRGSNSIEGFDAELDDAAAVAIGEEPLDASTETRLALEGYRNAMTYVLQIAQEPPIELSQDLIKSLHFMMTHHDLKNRPGRWRQGAIFVRDERSGAIVYEGPDVALVPRLIDEFIVSVNSSTDTPIVRAAMAHLNLVMIHPFRDGNGRMSRCVQSLVLATEGTLSPVFMSIEEHLGRNTQAYYDVLAAVGNGSWHPESDTRPWIRFTIAAHLHQAKTVQRRVRDSERLWSQLEHIVQAARLPERVIPLLFDATLGLRVRNATYRALLADNGEEVTEATAGRDLKGLADADFLVARGEKRGRHYVAGERLLELRAEIATARAPKDERDPFASEG